MTELPPVPESLRRPADHPSLTEHVRYAFDQWKSGISVERLAYALGVPEDGLMAEFKKLDAPRCAEGNQPNSRGGHGVPYVCELPHGHPGPHRDPMYGDWK